MPEIPIRDDESGEHLRDDESGEVLRIRSEEDGVESTPPPALEMMVSSQSGGQGFYFKQGDTFPSIRVRFVDATGAALNFTGCTVKLLLKRRGASALTVNRALVAESTVQAQFRLDWQSGETDVAGTYDAEFEVTYSTGAKLTLPGNGYLAVVMRGQLG